MELIVMHCVRLNYVSCANERIVDVNILYMFCGY